MALDVNSEKGKESVRQEAEMLKGVEKCWNYNVVVTNKNKEAICDGFLVKKREVVAIFESKCRDLSYNELENYGSWLITYDKIKTCKYLSELLKVPFIGFLYLIKDNITLFWKITDSDGKYLFEFNHNKTLTQETINGGKIYRDNAYLPFSEAKFVHKEEIMFP